ncbi:MAG: hypothetical protein ACW967_11325 [Candidatus Hodarchaeales archaeon]|jgi:hypothetical protein
MVKETVFHVEDTRTVHNTSSPISINRSFKQNLELKHELKQTSVLSEGINSKEEFSSLTNSTSNNPAEFSSNVNHSIIYDSNNQFAEKIVFDLEINVNKTGDYIVETFFNRTEENEFFLPIVNSTQFSLTQVGFQLIKIELNGFQITSKLKSENFSLELVSAGLFFINEMVSVNDTNYNYKIENLFIGDFITIGKIDSQSIMIHSLDLNENGLFDAIEINTSVNIGISGEFLIIGNLYATENETGIFLNQFFERFSDEDKNNFSFIIDSVILFSLEQSENQHIRLELLLVNEDFLTDFITISNINLSLSEWELELLFDVQMEFKEYFEPFFRGFIKVINVNFVNIYDYFISLEYEFYIEAENKTKIVDIPQIYLDMYAKANYDSDFYIWHADYIVDQEFFTSIFIIKYFGKKMEYRFSFSDGFKSETTIAIEEDPVENKSLPLPGITGIILIIFLAFPFVRKKRR